ncbi:MAG TPA: polyprenyl synthetase family protein [Candidatus Kapabacteria bacterium]|nr:polyprenyl synthetase family protein [Candidatus Kapabacteria bacterium]
MNPTFERYKTLIDERLRRFAERSEPQSLYEPTHYVLGGGGKRVRGVLVLLAADAVGGAADRVVDAGAAVETLHNFTLVHDDIMDRAETRRGRPTVHTRWDEGTAILAGDVMIGLAYEAVIRGELDNKLGILDALTRGIIDVCEGQALDCELARRVSVSLDDYLHMIAMKTARLAETAAEVGAIAGGGTPEQIAALRSYARNIGLAFQIQDDILDITAEQADFGKRIGGDVIEGKRTYLLVRALQSVTDGADRVLLDWLVDAHGLPATEVANMRDLYERNGLIAEAHDAVRSFTARAESDVAAHFDESARQSLTDFAEMLLERNS